MLVFFVRVGTVVESKELVLVPESIRMNLGQNEVDYISDVDVKMISLCFVRQT